MLRTCAGAAILLVCQNWTCASSYFPLRLAYQVSIADVIHVFDGYWFDVTPALDAGKELSILCVSAWQATASRAGSRRT